MENEFPATGGGVDVFRQALKANVSVVQISNPLNEVFERSAQPVKPPDNEGITLPYIVAGAKFEPENTRLMGTQRVKSAL